MNLQESTQIDHEQIRKAACLLLEDHLAMETILNLCACRDPREDGIPAILIIEEFGVPQKKRQAMPGDETMGFYYAVLATALTMLVEMNGSNNNYPAVCLAMSAIAEKAFQFTTYDKYRQNQI